MQDKRASLYHESGFHPRHLTEIIENANAFFYKSQINSTFGGNFTKVINLRVSNHMPNKVWNEITYSFPNNTVEVSEWISNLPHTL